MKGTSLKHQKEEGIIEMETNWKRILGWCILSFFFLIPLGYIMIMLCIAKPVVLIGLGLVGIFIIGMHLVTTY
jgi:hypothetical protein